MAAIEGSLATRENPPPTLAPHPDPSTPAPHPASTPAPPPMPAPPPDPASLPHQDLSTVASMKATLEMVKQQQPLPGDPLGLPAPPAGILSAPAASFNPFAWTMPGGAPFYDPFYEPYAWSMLAGAPSHPVSSTTAHGARVDLCQHAKERCRSRKKNSFIVFGHGSSLCIETIGPYDSTHIIVV